MCRRAVASSRGQTSNAADVDAGSYRPWLKFVQKKRQVIASAIAGSVSCRVDDAHQVNRRPLPDLVEDNVRPFGSDQCNGATRRRERRPSTVIRKPQNCVNVNAVDQNGREAALQRCRRETADLPVVHHRGLGSIRPTIPSRFMTVYSGRRRTLMSDFRQLLEATDARTRLRTIPGVERIGLGLKETAGEARAEYVFRVYVQQKKPLSELRPEEIIPAEIDGIKTDVVVLQDVGRLCKTNLEPGMQITREIPNYIEGSGTLGCIVRKGSKAYVLTNEHVIVPDESARRLDRRLPAEEVHVRRFDVQCPRDHGAQGHPWRCAELRRGHRHRLDTGLPR